MGRLHLFELEDQGWFPQILRDCGTDFLRFASTRFDQTAHLVPRLETLLRETSAGRVVDLCAGGGGPMERIAADLEARGKSVPVILTDRFPNRAAFERIRDASHGRIDFTLEPVDARAVPPGLDGVRTLFNGFHHFSPDDARAILADAVARRQPIAIVELVARRPLALLGIVLNALLGIFLITPFIRPFRWSRLLFTYVIPAVPLLVLWDGVVSCLRVYSPEELRELYARIPAEDWRWQAGTLPNSFGPVPLTYLIGQPTRS